MAARTADELKHFADRYLAECFDQENKPQVAELAAKFHLSRNNFSELFTRLVGEYPSSYLRRGQIEFAKRLLTETDLLMNAIAYKCGFGTRRTFYRTFKRLVGMTPLAYRRSMR